LHFKKQSTAEVAARNMKSLYDETGSSALSAESGGRNAVRVMEELTVM
jgi:hypothetical protein